MDERELTWAAVQVILLAAARDVGNPWPDEFAGRTNEECLLEILRTEEEVRPALDASCRSLARNQRLPMLTNLERWHLAHRLVFAVAYCKKGLEGGQDFAEDEELGLEALLVVGWKLNLPTWREQMRRKMESL